MLDNGTLFLTGALPIHKLYGFRVKPNSMRVVEYNPYYKRVDYMQPYSALTNLMCSILYQFSTTA